MELYHAPTAKSSWPPHPPADCTLTFHCSQIAHAILWNLYHHALPQYITNHCSINPIHFILPITFLFFWPPQSTAGSGLRQEKLTPLLRSALACARFLLFSLRVKKTNC